MSEVNRFYAADDFSGEECVLASDFDRVTAERDAAPEEVERVKNIDHRQILAESAAKYLLDSGAENFVGDVFTIEADDGQTKFEVIVTTQKVGAKSPGELCSDLQQRLTAAGEQIDALTTNLRFAEESRQAFAEEWDQLEQRHRAEFEACQAAERRVEVLEILTANQQALINEVLTAFKLEPDGSCITPGRDFIRPWAEKVAALNRRGQR